MNNKYSPGVSRSQCNDVQFNSDVRRGHRNDVQCRDADSSCWGSGDNMIEQNNNNNNQHRYYDGLPKLLNTISAKQFAP